MTSATAQRPRIGARRPVIDGLSSAAAALAAAALLSACGGGGGSSGSPTGPLTVTPQPVLAGGVATWRVALPAGSTANVTLRYRTADLGSSLGDATGGAACGGGVDYVASGESQLATGGSQTVTISVNTCANASFEPNERLELQIDWQGGVTRSTNLIVNNAAGGLNDTGITQCLDAAGALVACSAASALAGQDGATGRDLQALTSDDADGRAGFSFATSGDCVTDRVTGLQWQQADAAAGTLADAQALATAANAASLCGHDDWRLPAAQELLSLVDGGLASGARIDPAFTAGAAGTWAAEPAAVDVRAQWLVDFASGAASYDTASNPLAKPYRARLVRGDAGSGIADDCSADADRYTAGGGTVTDARTGLMWMACADGLGGSDCASGSATSYATYAEALARAAAVNASASLGLSHDDWRVPNRNELASLVNRACRAPAIQRSAFPGTPSASFWTASPALAGFAWYVDFTEGELAPGGVNGDRLLRLVRGGQ